MASKAIDGEAVVVFGDDFLADEILARLPARCVFRCTVLSKRFRRLLTCQHFWLRQSRLGAPLELPHAARVYRHECCKVFDFHVVGPAFAMKHTVEVEYFSWYASTCNGLVLLSGMISHQDEGQSSVEGIVFNPATKEEARLSLPLPRPQNKDVERHILGFWYGPSSKVYKALILEDFHDCTMLMVVSLDGSGSQEPRTVFSTRDDLNCCDSLYTADGKVYFISYGLTFVGNDGEVRSMLAFDIDNEVVTRIAVPEEHEISYRMMLKVHGRPCIYMEKGHDTVLWLLSTDHRWEQLYTLVKESSWLGDCLKGLWDCGGGLLFAEFEYDGAYMYNLHEAVREEKEGSSGSRLTPVRSLKIKDKWLKKNCPTNLWDYEPTLISPASIFDNAAFSDRGCESVEWKHELEGTHLEMTQKSLIDPMMHMLSGLRPPSG